MRWLLAMILLVGMVTSARATAAPQCPDVVDPRAFTSATAMRDLNAKIAGFGLRSTGSPAHQRMLDWLDRRVRQMPGMTVASQTFRIRGWQPLGQDLTTAGWLIAGGELVPVAGAIPYTRPGFAGGELVHLPSTERITAANAGGKVVIRDFPPVDRGYLAEPVLNRDLADAGLARAAGLVVAFDFPRSQVRGYWDPHTGTHTHVPGVFVGVDEAQRLKQLAAAGGRAHLAVLAGRDRVTTRSLIATLPGQSKERIVLDTNTDGNTWVQENGNVALLALAEYFAALPQRCRPRTLEFVFATGHLHRSAEGSEFRARDLDADYDKGTVAFAFVLEHLGTKEFLPVPRANGTLRELKPSGAAEFFAWFAGSPSLIVAANQAITRHALDRAIVLPGIDLPNPARVPPQCSFGGIGTHFHGHLIPTMATISGPWSLWAPSFGEQAIDYNRMFAQTLAAGDSILALGTVPREQIAGPYLAYRQARAAGAPTCSHELPPEEDPILLPGSDVVAR